MKRLIGCVCVVIGITALSLSTGCGGGGGGGFVGAARVFLDASPNKVDTGDRVSVETRIEELHENGIALKFRYPVGLDYVASTSFLRVDGETIDVGPTENVRVEDYRFLVFYLGEPEFGEERDGTLTFELEASAEIPEGQIEVDPDVDDINVSNTTEFNRNDPEFRAEDATDIEVVD